MRSRHVTRISAQLGGGMEAWATGMEPSGAQREAFECHGFLCSIKLLASLPLVLRDGSRILLQLEDSPLLH